MDEAGGAPLPKIDVVAVTNPKELAPDLREAALADLLVLHGVDCWRNLPPVALDVYTATAKHSTNGGMDGVQAEYDGVVAAKSLTESEKAKLWADLVGGLQ